MTMMLQVINETLRCGNIVKFVHRKALKDVRYKGKIKWMYFFSSCDHIHMIVSNTVVMMGGSIIILLSSFILFYIYYILVCGAS